MFGVLSDTSPSSGRLAPYTGGGLAPGKQRDQALYAVKRAGRIRTVLAQAGAGSAGGPDADPDEVEPGFEPVWPEAEAGPFGAVAGLG